MIVDSQVHLWRAESPDRPWPPGGKERAHLPDPMSYQTMLRMMDSAGVDRAIVVPPSWEGDRNDYALEAAARHPDRFAAMGRIALDDPDSRDRLPAWRRQRGMLGVRLTFTGSQAAWLEDGTADWFWPAAERARLPVMLHQRGGLRKIAEIARSRPDLNLIIDHMGLNHAMALEGACAQGIEQVLPLAAFPNVSVKLSSAPTYSREPYPFADMDEPMRRLVEAFGARRCFWGTDFTHAPERCSYAQRKTHFTDHLDFLNADEKELVMGKALLACLRWGSSEVSI